ncbi:hypothetical protein U0C82_03645 [Fulvimarina sp. 2208YS6-2-32]|uniref:Uncharacterized protein n=1 Tax=Fulvimarina uroteuthidis TaxID=3098149 RepID=A0ABU5HYQ1_9HYPH|nr:hypothetical protein [Fulvimarina sp. 2208YS6-2-32]MDY8108242.1 hypothetical protein [Fulvimarina sp. 2208YS6-2-32]
MDITALIEPATKELFGYGVLGIAVIALTTLYWMERKDRKEADKASDAVRDAAEKRIEEIQTCRINEMRSAIDSIRKGDEVMDDMQSSFERRLDGIKSSLDTLISSGRGR